MVKVFTRLAVEDFEKWQTDYDSHEPVRQQYGFTGSQVYRNDKDANEVALTMEWNSLEELQAFISESNLQEVQKQSGATSLEVCILQSL